MGNYMVETITEELLLRDYKAEDGMAMLASLPGGLKDFPDAEKRCKEAEEDGKAFTVIYEGKMVACAGIITKMEGVGVAWALYPLDIGKYPIDPQIAKNKLRELMIKYDFRRVEATARVDYPAASSYLRYLNFEREGLMKKYEPDETDAYLYAITR